MSQIALNHASLRYTEYPLLNDISLTIEPGERVAIVGRNGMGKSTLMHVLAGRTSLDTGELMIARGTCSSLFLQDDYPKLSGPIGQALIDHLDQHDVGSHYWSIQTALSSYLSQLCVDPEQDSQTLSGGQLRRAWLAFALAQEADIYFLDEPTNHLDIPTMQWLTQTLATTKATLILISHDRQFMQNLCTRYIDLEHGHIRDFSGRYEDFIKHREQSLAAEATAQKLANKVLAQEEAWIRQGIKARRTRNEGRVRNLKKLREEAKARRQHMGNLTLTQQKQAKTGKELISCDQVSIGYGDTLLIKSFDSILFRGDKIAIIGANGTGKTSLIRTLLSEQAPLHGIIEKRHDLTIRYFDQAKQILDGEQTIVNFVSAGRTHIPMGDSNLHIISYLNNFLFSHQQAQSKIHSLSGGEKNRVLLAYILSFTADILILDEPTNDLDLETLEVLENYLNESKLTLLFTSHDQYFINAVASTLWAINDKQLIQFDGSYDDWIIYNKERAQPAYKEAKAMQNKASTNQPNKKPKKLSYHEERTLKTLPDNIEKNETALTALHEAMSNPDFFKQDPDLIRDKQQQLEQLQQTIDAQYTQWEALIQKQNSLS